MGKIEATIITKLVHVHDVLVFSAGHLREMFNDGQLFHASLSLPGRCDYENNHMLL